MPYAAFAADAGAARWLYAPGSWLQPALSRDDLVWGEGRYYDTTVGRKHQYWKDKALPRPSKDLATLRGDFTEWGFCLVEDALSPEQNERIMARIAEQAEAERLADAAADERVLGGALQIVPGLINKGKCFVDCLEFDPAAMQGAPLVKQLLDEALGRGWCHFSFIANISPPDGLPQPMHQDQSYLGIQRPEAPALVNTIYIPHDVDEHNGGTLVIPGSHTILAGHEPGEAFDVDTLPPAINLEAPAGSILLLDGRVLHGTAVNKSKSKRYILTQANVKPWVRTQENWYLLIRPEVLETLSDELLKRLGFFANTSSNVVELTGWGQLSTNARNTTVPYRQAMDAGTFERVGELTPDMVRADSPTFTTTEVQQAARLAGGR